MILEDLGFCFSNLVTVADGAARRHLHDCSPATARATPPQCQRGNRLAAVATCIGMLHCWHSLSNSGSAKDTASRFLGQCKGTRLDRSGVAIDQDVGDLRALRSNLPTRDVSVSVVLPRLQRSPPRGAYRCSRAACLRPRWHV